MGAKIFAAIDVGSFELEMGVYEISGKNGVHQIDRVRHIIPLGKDTYNTGVISYGLVNEMCSVLSDFAKIMEGYQADSYRAYATSAMREAQNNQIVLDQIKVRTGLDVKIISNSEQRLLSYKAIAAKEGEFNKLIQKGTAIVDVGFGSMQMSLFDKDALVSTHNLGLGALRMREMISHVRAAAEEQIHLLEEIVDNELFVFRKMYLKDREIKNLIGAGEELLYLARGMGEESERTYISAKEMTAFYQRITKMSLGQLQETFGVTADYATLLLPSAMIYKRVMELSGAEIFWIPSIRLGDGMAAEYAEEKRLVKFHHNFSEDILAAARNMAKRYKCHMSHNQAMERYAMDIFDAMKKYHGLGKRERLLLQIAVNLHSCGKFVSMRDYSECAYNIIMSTEIIGLSHEERKIIANTVRYNQQPFSYEVARDNMMLIAKLVAILRLVNSMDRSHSQKLSDCKIAVRDGELIVSTGYEGDITLERLAFESKIDFFEEIYGIRPVLKQKRRV
ncbi:exopolyphosphatase [Lachnospiraceae bacterium 62-35]